MPGFRLRFEGPFFDEFALECPLPAERVRNALLKEGILAGIPLGGYDPAWKNVLLVGATEQRTDDEVDRFAAALGRAAK